MKLTDREIIHLLSAEAAPREVARLHADARRLADETVGRAVPARGLVEVTNECRNNCLYCGIRRDSTSVTCRYTLTDGQILGCCRAAHAAGLRTFVLQGGESASFGADRVEALVAQMAAEFPDTAITLSLGEWSDTDLERFRRAGARRYLLRHETKNAAHYSRLHPPSMSQANRLRCLDTLKRLGYETGTGIMVGSPFQTVDHIMEDLEYMCGLQPDMIGIGPFVPAAGTPFAGFPQGSVELTLRLISVLRLLFPRANMPATTALATLDPERGRIAGLMAGANVVMPNVSPADARKAYSIYDHKAATGTEGLEGLGNLRLQLAESGFKLE